MLANLIMIYHRHWCDRKTKRNEKKKKKKKPKKKETIVFDDFAYTTPNLMINPYMHFNRAN